MRFLFGMLILLSFSCKSQKDALSKYDKIYGLVLIEQEEYGGVSNFETRIITNDKDLRSFYGTINKIRKPGLMVPSIDFLREQVLVVSSGEISGKHNPQLSIKDETSENIIIGVSSKPNTESDLATITTVPFCIYKMKKTEKKIIFKLL